MPPRANCHKGWFCSTTCDNLYGGANTVRGSGHGKCGRFCSAFTSFTKKYARVNVLTTIPHTRPFSSWSLPNQMADSLSWTCDDWDSVRAIYVVAWDGVKEESSNHGYGRFFFAFIKATVQACFIKVCTAALIKSEKTFHNVVQTFLFHVVPRHDESGSDWVGAGEKSVVACSKSTMKSPTFWELVWEWSDVKVMCVKEVCEEWWQNIRVCTFWWNEVNVKWIFRLVVVEQRINHACHAHYCERCLQLSQRMILFLRRSRLVHIITIYCGKGGIDRRL